jgi:cysteinyl-tRNA synthetase
LADRAAAADAPLSASARSLHDAFVGAIDDDLDLPAALRLARSVLTADIAADERRWLVLDMEFVLGLDLDRVWEGAPTNAAGRLPTGTKPLLEARARARAAGNWIEADRLRAALRDLGVEPIDRADGSSDWQPVPAEPPSG